MNRRLFKRWKKRRENPSWADIIANVSPGYPTPILDAIGRKMEFEVYYSKNIHKHPQFLQIAKRLPAKIAADMIEKELGI